MYYLLAGPTAQIFPLYRSIMRWQIASPCRRADRGSGLGLSLWTALTVGSVELRPVTGPEWREKITPKESAAKGGKRMAAALRAAASKNPDALVIVLTGNVHACKRTLPDVGSKSAAPIPSSPTNAPNISPVAHRAAKAYRRKARGQRDSPASECGRWCRHPVPFQYAANSQALTGSKAK